MPGHTLLFMLLLRLSLRAIVYYCAYADAPPGDASIRHFAMMPFTPASFTPSEFHRRVTCADIRWCEATCHYAEDARQMFSFTRHIVALRHALATSDDITHRPIEFSRRRSISIYTPFHPSRQGIYYLRRTHYDARYRVSLPFTSRYCLITYCYACRLYATPCHAATPRHHAAAAELRHYISLFATFASRYASSYVERMRLMLFTTLTRALLLNTTFVAFASYKAMRCKRLMMASAKMSATCYIRHMAEKNIIGAAYVYASAEAR